MIIENSKKEPKEEKEEEEEPIIHKHGNIITQIARNKKDIEVTFSQ